MIGPRTKSAIGALHWTVGLVVLLEAYRTFHGTLARLHDAGHPGALTAVRLVLSGSEIIAVLLFLIPVTAAAGGYALLVVFALAIAIHGLHGDFAGLEILMLYGAAVFVSLAERAEAALPPPAKIQRGIE
ncbi:MAG: hypothetical protein WA628_04650 [Terriglobales bacterium]